MNQRKVSIAILVILISIFISNSSIIGLMTNDDEESRKTLKGLKGVYVWVNLGTEAIEELRKIGLTEEVIQTDVELKLRFAGINVVSRKEIYSIPGAPQFTVDLGGYVTSINPSTQEKGVAFTIQVELFQKTYLARNSAITAVAGTWSGGSVGVGYTSKNIVTQIRNAIKEHVDSFINAYLSVNPKGEK